MNKIKFTEASSKQANKNSFNLLTPKSDQHLISPYNITPESHIKLT